MIVDDDSSHCLILTKHLADQSEILTADSGSAALEILKSTRIDLILLDQSMPDMDGFEVLLAIKSNPSWINIPVIMITADHKPVTEVAAFENGVSDFVSKPVIPQTLRARVMMQLELRRYRKKLTESYLLLEDEVRNGSRRGA